MEFLIYSRGTRVNYIEKKLKETGHEVVRKTYLIKDEYALCINITSLQEAVDLCQTLGIDDEAIKLSVSEL